MYKDVQKIRSYQETIKDLLDVHKQGEEEGKDVDELWEETRSAVIEAATKSIGELEKTRNADWFDEECAEAIKQKNAARQMMLSKNTRNNKKTYKELRLKAHKLLKKMNQKPSKTKSSK